MVYKIEKSPTKSPNKGAGITQSITEEFNFTVPPEAPVYFPTTEEFQDPLLYIAKIRPVAEKYGICKIKPPQDWQPPFAVDVDRLKFTPRIQRLNELEAKTRIKLNFLDQIAKFWELQGSSLKIPMVEKRALDLYALHTLIDAEGGFINATANRKWAKVAVKMGFPSGRDLGSVLKHHYERILHPFDIFKQGKTLSNIKKEEANSDSEQETKKKEKDYKPHGIVSRQAIKPPVEKYARRSKRCFQKVKGESEQKKPEVVQVTVTRSNKKTTKETKKIFHYEMDPLAKYVCHNCERGDAEENMLLCDGCDDSYHTFCLLPPLLEIPKGDWRCPKCVAAEVSKPMEAFGFEQARREYTLQQFGSMADQFKSDYFNMPVHLVPSSLIEKEFWRIVSSIDEDVTVEYGADLHTMDHGSGFPTKISPEEMGTCEMEYAKSSWNLNNLPCLENSVLGHINADISGMKVPWMYVGMCFATFCWHNEDHWSYSINYLHWGEAKTWYGVPGEKADEFEHAMKRAAPELFQSQPDLLHQLVTIMNPNILMEAGVPVCRTDQEAGEFVITFPRAYHAGFNQGYNFAEAVNFAPADWLKIGRECVDHYSMLRRYCVFSHDELVCKMASNPDTLDHTVAVATYQDMLKMVESEKKLRKSLLEWGVTEAEREAFELLPDDERQCEVCKTTCFLSAVTCCCNNEQLVCLKHCTELCKCAPERHTLRYRYTLDELPVMLEKLKLRADCYDEWSRQVEDALDMNKEKVLTLNELKSLHHVALDKKFPTTDLLQSLSTAVSEAEKCASVASQLASKKLRTRTRQTAESKYKLTVEELTLFYEEITHLACVLKESDVIRDLLEKVREFQCEASKLVDLDGADSVTLEKCIDSGVSLDVDLPELVTLKQNLKRVTWLEEVTDTKEDERQVTLESLRSLLDAGVELPPHPRVETEMAELQMLLTRLEKWEERAKECISSKQRQPISAFEKLLTEAEEIPAYLPTENVLKDALKKAKDWVERVNVIEKTDIPYLETVETLVNKGRTIPVKLDLLDLFESKVENAKNWKERTARTFLRKNSRYTLMEALSPRTEFGINVLKMKKKKFNDDSAPVILDVKLEGNQDPREVVKAFKGAEKSEMSSMRSLRLQNLRKRANDTGEYKYCICRRGATGFMLQCELCKDCFHATCVPLPKHGGAKIKQSPAQQLAAAATREVKFLCPCCLRSRRPRLETILSLLVSLQKLEVRLPEGEALQCLTERAMNWQDRARTSLATEEIASALAKLSVLSQKLVEAAAREKTEKIISSELKKAAGKSINPEVHRRVRAMSGVSSNEDSQSSQNNQPGWLGNEEQVRDENNQSQDSMSDTISSLASPNYFSGNSEHAYSTASKSNLAKQPKQPPLALSEIARAELEELMLEGDLLEVSLDETLHIWRILQATKPKPEKEKYPPIEQLENELLASKAEKDKMKARQRARKRRIEEMEAMMVMKGKKTRIKPSLSAGGVSSSSRNTTPPLFNDLSKINVSSVAKKLPRKSFGGSGKQLKEGGKKMKGKMHQPPPSHHHQHQPQMKRKSMENMEENVKQKQNVQSVKRRRKIERESSTESDSDENCAARKCLKPTGKEVDWVQCDGGCEKWYHFRCLGINKKDIREDEDFICEMCRRQINIRQQQQQQQHHHPHLHHHRHQQQQQHVQHHHQHHHRTQQHAGVHQHHHLHQQQPTPDSSRVKVEPTNLDESLGLDALLSLANGLRDNDTGGMPLDNTSASNWLHQPTFPYDIPEMHRSFHNMPSIPTRSSINIATPLNNPSEMLINPNTIPLQSGVQSQTAPNLPPYQLPDQSYPSDHHSGYHPVVAERKQQQQPPQQQQTPSAPPPPPPPLPESQYYNIQDSFTYPHEAQNYQQNYTTNFQTYVQPSPTQTYPHQSYYSPQPAPQQTQPAANQYQYNFNKHESFTTETFATPEPYTLTQLSPTTLPKNNYTVQTSYPLVEQGYTQQTFTTAPGTPSTAGGAAAGGGDLYSPKVTEEVESGGDAVETVVRKLDFETPSQQEPSTDITKADEMKSNSCNVVGEPNPEKLTNEAVI